MISMCMSPKIVILRPPKPLSVRSASEEALYFEVLRKSNQRVEALRVQREQEFLGNEPEHAMFLQLEQVRCPLHLHRFKQSLEQLSPGQILKLQSKSGVLVKDLEAACRIMGIETKMLRYGRQYFLYATKASGQQATEVQK
jgi:TusA-related sulfurtransferase